MELPKIFNAVAAVVLTIAFASCSGDDSAKLMMDAAEAVVWDRPDSALSLLESVNAMKLKSKSSKARFSMLYAMALDRNGVDTADLSVIDPAVRYYESHGSDADRMRTFYYQGRMYYNAGDFQAAIKCLMCAREYSVDSKGLVFKGLISSAISDVYAQNNNLTEKIRFCEEAVGCFAEAGDERRTWVTTGRLASYYADRRDWAKADSLYSVFFSAPPQDTLVLIEHLFNAARYCLLKPCPDPALSISLFRKAVAGHSARPAPVDYCAYAYASELAGYGKVAESIFAQLDAAGCDPEPLAVWKYRTLKHKGDSAGALEMLERSVASGDSAVIASLNQSVSQAQSDYFKAKSELMEKDHKVLVMSRWIAALVGLIVLSSVVAVSLHSRKKWAKRVMDVSAINEDVRRRLSEEQDASSHKDRALENLRRKYVQTYKMQYNQLNDLCREYLETEGSGKEKDRIYAKVRGIVSLIDGCNQKRLERMIDENLDGIMRKLHEDLPDATATDFRFIALNILGFDAKTIARIMGYAVQSVYTKRVRLRARISALESENREFYLEFID